MIQIRAFRAPDDRETCERFILGHKRILEYYGITNITSNTHAWVENSNTYVIVAEDLKGEKIYGGARVQLSDGILPLPIETAIGKYDPLIYTIAKQPGVSEICGLWNSREVAGMGIGSVFMCRVGVVVALLLNVSKILFLAAPITVKMGKKMGAVIETSLGKKGNFVYPKDNFVATAMSINDCYTLSMADDYERNRIFSIYNSPDQEAIEQGLKGELLLKYKLNVTNHSHA